MLYGAGGAEPDAIAPVVSSSLPNQPKQVAALLLWRMTLGLLLSLGIALVSLWMLQARWTDSNSALVAGNGERLLRFGLATEVSALQYAVQEASEDEEALGWFLQGDREGLLARAQVELEELSSTLGVTHLYFILPDRTVFLRAHYPERYGDRIDRWTLQQALETGRSQAGLEIGVLGTLTLRAVQPLVVDGKVVGYLEIGQEIDRLVTQVELVLGDPVQVYLHKEFIDRSLWEERANSLDGTLPWDTLPEHVASGFPTSGEVEAFRSGASVQIPLHGAAGGHVGELAVWVDNSAQQSATAQSVGLLALLFVGLAGVLLALTWRVLRRVDLDLIAAHRLDVEHRQTLEIRVADRTRELEDEMAQRQHAETQLQHVQRMESLGQLTGGIAHDFNNALTVMIGNLALLAEECSEDSLDLVEACMGAAKNSAALTRQLLAFSRKQALRPSNFDLHEVIDSVLGLVRPTLEATIRIVAEPSEGRLIVFADRAQLENAVLNLVLNARDAMPSGGVLTLSAVEIADEPGFRAVVVEDTGTGIAPELVERVIEPFFTTKVDGKGTGLGLSMVYGFARQSGGDLELESVPGQGTCATLKLPVGDRNSVVARSESKPPPTGRARVLVVEDEPGVLRLATRVLSGAGYEVLTAADGPSAVEILEQVESVDLLFTDMVLPGGMDGAQIAALARQIRPGIPVLFASGYTTHSLRGEDLMGKPYTPSELLHRVQGALQSV